MSDIEPESLDSIALDKYTEQYREGLLDPKIKKLIKAIKYFGMDTTASCQGHLHNDQHPFPWVGIWPAFYPDSSPERLKVLKKLIETESDSYRREFKRQEIEGIRLGRTLYRIIQDYNSTNSIKWDIIKGSWLKPNVRATNPQQLDFLQQEVDKLAEYIFERAKIIKRARQLQQIRMRKREESKTKKDEIEPETQKREIEIIPWVHNILTTWHRDAVKYIERLPNRAVLFLEITPKELQVYKHYISTFGRFPNYYISKLLFGLEPGFFAYLDVITTCILKEIEIIPIETIIIEKQRELRTLTTKVDTKTLEVIKAYLQFLNQRDKAFVRNIVRTGISQAYVLCGAKHAKGVEQGLSSKGYEVTTNMEFFQDKASFVQSNQISKDIDRETERGDLTKLSQLIKLQIIHYEKYSVSKEKSRQLFKKVAFKMNFISKKMTQRVDAKLAKSKARRAEKETTTKQRLKDILRILRGKPRTPRA